jgi:hypothetical protein
LPIDNGFSLLKKTSNKSAGRFRILFISFAIRSFISVLLVFVFFFGQGIGILLADCIVVYGYLTVFEVGCLSEATQLAGG